MTDPKPLDLDAIETRANAATPGPWGIYQYGGDSLIEIAADLQDTGCGYTARRTIARLDEEPLDNDPTHRDWTAEEDWAQVQADAAYIAAMPPEVATALVAEVRRLRTELAAIRARGIADAAAWLHETGETNAAYLLRTVDVPAAEEMRAVADEPDADPICGDPNDGDWCELEPGHDGHHRADTAEWAADPAAPAVVPAR
ncbi:hypothetical protein [Streptomyces sp. NPDC127038]|uniref:hypothetical protein n=1 Tax=Streptomyces sp. NPDC127038 TaxID=3347114 RepID=UPI00364A94F7